MYTKFDLDKFIAENVIFRKESLFLPDLMKFDEELSKKIEGRSVLVIGGAGTIGSYYIKAVLKYKIKRLFVVDINENGLTELVRDLRSSSQDFLPEDFKTYPIDFGDSLFYKMLAKESPFDIIVNFAAHKHVRSEKDMFSIEAMIENNVLHAKKLLDVLLENPPKYFFCVSTDKAANPVNVMGATKKLMEEVIMAYSKAIPITTARFANVAFSNGSLLAGFIDRLNKKQPLVCPSDIKRFFVSPQESGQLCLLASILGESGDIFYPKLDMKNGLLSLSEVVVSFLKEFGYVPDICQSEEEVREKMGLFNDGSMSYPVYFFKSDTSGEKSFEEFYTEEDSLNTKTFINLGVIKNSKKNSISEVGDMIFNLTSLLQKNCSKKDIVDALKKYLPSFNHVETGKNLDEKM